MFLLFSLLEDTDQSAHAAYLTLWLHYEYSWQITNGWSFSRLGMCGWTQLVQEALMHFRHTISSEWFSCMQMKFTSSKWGEKNQPWLWFLFCCATPAQSVKFSRFLFVCLYFPRWCVQGALYEFHFMSISCHFLSEISQMSEALTPHCLVYFRCPSPQHIYRRWLRPWPDLNYKTETHEISLL